MFVTAGLLVLSLGQLGQALVPLVPEHEGSGDVTVAPEVEVTKKKFYRLAFRFSKYFSILGLVYGFFPNVLAFFSNHKHLT